MDQETADNLLPRVAVLGGCGFIGRNLVGYLIENNLVRGVRVIDKVPPQIAWLNKKHSSIFEDPRVEFTSANLINPVSCENSLRPGPDFPTWDVVINCAGETKLGQEDAIYKEGILNIALNCAKECTRLQVKRFIEVSSGCMYSSEKVPHTEDGPLQPWTLVSKWKRKVEDELANKFSDLKYTIVRPGIVYGIGDRRGLTPRLVVAAVYKHLNETMRLMWTPELKMNTISILDTCRAIWFLVERNESVHQTYNIVDAGDATQGVITDIVSDIFHIEYNYWGTAKSNLAKTFLKSALEDANDKHLESWAKACAKQGIQNTPLDPYMTTEFLLNKHTYLDGSKLQALGFKLQIERLTKEQLIEVIDDYVEMGLFPKSLLI